MCGVGMRWGSLSQKLFRASIRNVWSTVTVAWTPNRRSYQMLNAELGMLTFPGP